ncbi:hypothetical protein ACTJKJ_08690 [Roseateles sp. 22389]|uniref:hypothetical protein n=1 Tax=Roseateles sp. 22389 TaxID=3453916 RepID=UPI003F873490
MHKPDPKLPADKQDKLAVIQVEPEHWATWLTGTVDEARALFRPAPVEVFDQADAAMTDAILPGAGR